MAIQPPRRILIAMDGSASSEYAFDWFKEYFLKDRDDVHLFHCTEPEPHSSFFKASSSRQSVHEQHLMESADVIQHMEDIIGQSQFKGSVVHVSGSKVGEAIMKTCEENRIDLIIMGGRGTRPTSKRSHLGSVVHYIMHNSKIPTVVCHIPELVMQH